MSALAGDGVVELVEVDERVLVRLVVAATGGAQPDEVTPPVGGGPGWTGERVAWLVDFHRDRREGLHGPAGEATWAVVLDGEAVGSVRLARTDADGTLETGIWLARPARRRGVGAQAMTVVFELAAGLGADRVIAMTTAANLASQALLTRVGFALTRTGDRVEAVRVLGRTDARPG